MNNHLCCSTHCYNKFPFERALKGIADAGIKYIELGAIPGHCDHVRPELMSSMEMKELKRKIEDYGLKVVSISGHCDLTSEKGVELFKKRIELAFNTGASIVNTTAGHVENSEDESNFFNNMKKIVKHLSEKNIIAALETHGGILGTARECKATIKRINSEYVKINYDPANLIYFCGLSPENDIINIVDSIVHFHIKDKLEGKGVWNFPAIGDGYINFIKIFDILYKNNYTGPYSFEIEFTEKGPQNPEEVDITLNRSVDYVKKLFKKCELKNCTTG